MMNKFLSRLLVSVMFMGLGVSQFAAEEQSQESPLVATLSAYLIDAESGEKVELDADNNKVRPSDVLEYQVEYKNISDTDLSGVMAVLPIPANMSYHVDTALPQAAEASIDGLEFSAIPLRRVVEKEDGTSEEKDVPVEEYRVLRWNLGSIKAKESALVSARMGVDALNDESATQ